MVSSALSRHFDWLANWLIDFKYFTITKSVESLLSNNIKHVTKKNSGAEVRLCWQWLHSTVQSFEQEKQHHLCLYLLHICDNGWRDPNLHPWMTEIAPVARPVIHDVFLPSAEPVLNSETSHQAAVLFFVFCFCQWAAAKPRWAATWQYPQALWVIKFIFYKVSVLLWDWLFWVLPSGWGEQKIRTPCSSEFYTGNVA